MAVEKHFQNVLVTMAYSTGRKRLLELGRFLDSLEDDYAAYEPYLLELMQRLPGIMQALEVTGFAPEPLHCLAKKLRALQMQMPALAEIEGLSAALDRVQQNVARLYAYAGDWQKSLASLDERNIAGWQTWLTEVSNGCHQSPRMLLRELRERAQREHSEISAALDEMAERWTPMCRAEENSVLAPVIERSLLHSNRAAEEGGLRCLTIQILGAAPGEHDEINADVHVLGTPPATDILQAPVAAGRRLLAETHPQLARKYFAGRLKFELAPAMHEGRSANLAIAALFYCAATRHAQQRLQYRLAAHVAITGEVDEKGEVLPVDDESLVAKINAVFFSWVEYLVVPKAQLAVVENLVNGLMQSHPNRGLTVIGAGHLREIFYDRRLAQRRRIGVARYLARRAWRNKFNVIGLAVITLLALLLGKLLYGPIDKNPVAAEFAEEMLLLKNRYGEIVDEIWVGAPTVTLAGTLSEGNQATGAGLVDFFDIDGDGVNEVIWSQQGVERTGNLSMVHCKSVKDDTVLWSSALTREMHFPHKPEVKGNQFTPVNLAVDDFDRDGRPEVFVLANHHYFPSLVMKLEAVTGREKSHYVHTGHLNPMEFADLDGDGIAEVLLGGLNNAFRIACLVVLDSRFVAGHSPTAGDYALADHSPGWERAYVLIPKTVVGEAFRYEAKYSIATRIEVKPSSRSFSLMLREEYCKAKTPSYTTDGVTLFALFDFDLRAQNFGTDDSYDLMAEKLFDEGRIPLVPNHVYFESFKQKLRYWDGAEWRNEAVGNKLYLEACKVK